MQYDQLLDKLNELFDTIENHAQDDTQRLAGIKAASMIGRLVHEYKQETGLFTKQIAKDLGYSPTNLDRYSQFYRAFPEPTGEIDGKPLTLSHYIAVLSLRGKDEREFYLKQAVAQGWSSSEIRKRVVTNFYETSRAGEIVPRKLKTALRCLYIYMADVLNVIDGDTLLLNIDVGFQIKMELKVRLYGINCPELGTKTGEKAKQFVIDELSKCVPSEVPGSRVSELTGLKNESNNTSSRNPLTQPLVAVQTHKVAEKYGRYLVDVYYLPGETKRETIVKDGIWLNQLLVDKKLAVII